MLIVSQLVLVVLIFLGESGKVMIDYFWSKNGETILEAMLGVGGNIVFERVEKVNWFTEVVVGDVFYDFLLLIKVPRDISFISLMRGSAFSGLFFLLKCFSMYLI